MSQEQASWDAAEAIARKHAASKHGPPLEVIRHTSIPHYFQLAYDDGSVWLLVHQGQVLEQTGLDALGAYLGDIGFIDRKTMTAADMLLLIEQFATLPPVTRAAPENFYRYDAMPALKPVLAWSDDGARLLLSYLYQSTGPRRGGRAGNKVSLEQWALVIPRQGKLAWRYEGDYWYHRDTGTLEKTD